jgi:predicted regulator of Ras-like GTPase activity (Roadblock/LC7/MglB family)
VLGLRAVDPAQALADLTEISSQIEAAVLADANGTVLASTFADEEKGERLARAVFGLVEAAEKAHGETKERLVQIEAATPDGSLFVVRDDVRLAAAVTGADPTSGLVFYDLKTCLRLVGEEKPTEKKTTRGRETRRQERTDDAPA